MEATSIPSHRRRMPQQERSRQRVEAILAAAQELIVEAGSDAMKMSEVASRAGVPIGSVYQYFPDKAAVLRELALRFVDRVHLVLAAGLAGIDSKAAAIERFDALLAGYYRMFVDDPGVREVWAATQSDKELQRLDVDDSRANGDLVARALQPFVGRRGRKRLATTSFLLVHLAGAAARLAIVVEPAEGARMIEEFRLVVRRHLEELLDD